MTDELRMIAVRLAREAGDILLNMKAGRTKSKSSPTDLVTEADHAAERYIVEALTRERPNDAIVAEEGSSRTGTSGVSWVVDPLDGTVNYVYGIPQWCVSIGIEGDVRAGVIHDPSRGETFTDVDPLTPSGRTDLSEALVGTGFAYDAQLRAKQGKVVARVLPKVRDIRRAGSCALDLAWVACGRLDAFYEEATNHWDISAGIALIEAAGAFVRTHGTLTIAAGTEELLGKLEALVI